MAESSEVDVGKVARAVMRGDGDEALRLLKQMDLSQVEGLVRQAHLSASPQDVLKTIQQAGSVDELLGGAERLGISLKDLAGLAGGFMGLFGGRR